MSEFPLDLYPPADFTREDILRQIFGEVGDLCHDFSCAVDTKVLLHGRMYVTNRFLCFYSNLFGVEKKIRIPYSHITLITKENTALVIPNAIAIATNRKEYLFRSFWDRDDCFRILQDFTEKYKALEQSSLLSPNRYGHGHSVRDGMRERSGSLSSTNSLNSGNYRDAYVSPVPILSTPPDRKECASLELKSILRRKTMPSSMPCSAKNLLQTLTTPQSQLLTQTQSLPPSMPCSPRRSSIRTMQSTPHTPSGTTTPIVAHTYLDPSTPIRVSPLGSLPCPSPHSLHSPPLSARLEALRELSTSGSDKEDTSGSKSEGMDRNNSDVSRTHTSQSERPSSSSALPPSSTTSTPTSSLLTIDVSDTGSPSNPMSFDEEDKRVKLKMIVLTGEILPVSLDQFAAMFIDDDAPWDMKRYHESVNDTAVVMSPWTGPPHTAHTHAQHTPSGRASSPCPAAPPFDQGLLREIRFLKAVNLPGLKSTRALKVQRYVRCGSEGLIVCSSTRLEDVPSADFFSVEDTISVRAKGDDKVEVEITFEVKFARSIILRFAIETATKSEMTKWLKDYFAVTKMRCASAESSGLSLGKQTSPQSAVCVSPLRQAASSGIALRKKSQKNLLNASNDSDVTRSSSPLHTHEKNVLRSPGKRTAAGGARRTKEGALGRKGVFTVQALFTIVLFMGLILSIHIYRTERQWREINDKLDLIHATLIKSNSYKSKSEMSSRISKSTGYHNIHE